MNAKKAGFKIWSTLIIPVMIVYCVTVVALQRAYAETIDGVTMSVSINDWDQPSVFSEKDPVTVSLSLDPAEYAGLPADWWILARIESGEFFYLADTGNWAGPVPLNQTKPALQYPLFKFADAPIISTPGLPPGDYQFYFGIDKMSGTMDLDGMLTTSTPLSIVEVPNFLTTDSGTGTLRKEGALWILNLKGSYYDMGRQYGFLVKKQLLAMYEILDADIGFDSLPVQAALAQMEPTMDDRERMMIYGMSQESGLSFEQLRFIGSAIVFSYFPTAPHFGCSVFGATRTQTTSGTTLIGRNFDNPSDTMDQLSGRSAVIIYNPVGEVHGNSHTDNAVAVITTLGWIFGPTTFNARGLDFEYLNGMISVPNLDLTIADGLHQNLFAAFDCDTEDQVDARYLNAKTAVATLTQVSDATHIWHYERSPLENSRKLLAGQASGAQYYANPADMDIFTNHYFLTDHIGQSFQYTSPDNDSNSRSFQRLVNIQTLAQQVIGHVDAAALQQIMLTNFPDGGTYWSPFITGTADQNDYTAVTDVKNMSFQIFPSSERERASWVEVDLKQEFR